MKKIILASQSPRRKQLLEQVGLQFEVEASQVEESFLDSDSPEETVCRLSRVKAEDVASRNPNSVIIGADTVAIFEDQIIGKPKGTKSARELLTKMSGKTHEIVTGFTVIDSDTGKSVTESVISRVRFRDLGEDEIDRYVESGEPLDKAGAYGIQEKGAVLVDHIDGDYSNIVGLPLTALSETLKQFNVRVL